MKGLFRFVIFHTLILLLIPAAAGAANPNPHNSTKCLLCHKEIPRFGVDTRETVTFRGDRSSDDPALCAFCHKPEENLHPIMVKPSKEMMDTETPSLLPLGESGDLKGKVVCTTCHFYHAAQTDHALLRGFPGSQKPSFFTSWQDFCRDCHGEGLSRRSPHAGDDQACAFCHQKKPTEGEPVKVAPRGVALCNFCHGAIQNHHYENSNPFEETVKCFTCHGPHLGPENPALLKKSYLEAVRDVVTIDPHYRKGLCLTCHREEEGYPLRNDDFVELCNRCHGSGQIIGDIHPLRKVPETISVPEGWPLSGGKLTCMTCHLAGHPEHRGQANFLRGGPSDDRNDFCLNCHDRKQLENRNPHQDINAGKGCDFCHAERPIPGRDTIDTVRLIADPNILCLRCHEPPPHPSDFDHTLTIDAERAKTISNDLPVYNGTKIVCATCHNPHIDGVVGNKLRGGVEGMMICMFCHEF